MNTTIYGLIDPITNELRYIGKSNNIKTRLNDHIQSSKKYQNTHKQNWINKLIKLGYKPQLIIIDEVDINNWQYWETFWINYFIYIGCKLTNNLTANGNGSSTGNKTSFKKGDGAKPIYQIDLNGNIINEYTSCITARNILGYKISYANTKYRTCHGFIFYKKEIWNNLTVDDKNEIILCATTLKFEKIKNNENCKKSRFKKGESNSKKTVYKYDLNGNLINTFESLKDAKKEANNCKIGEYINGNRKNNTVYIWSYEKINN